MNIKVKKRNKKIYDGKVASEARERREVEAEVERLEVMELKLIERLKKTQQQQQRAYIHLENALIGE